MLYQESDEVGPRNDEAPCFFPNPKSLGFVVVAVACASGASVVGCTPAAYVPRACMAKFVLLKRTYWTICMSGKLWVGMLSKGNAATAACSRGAAFRSTAFYGAGDPWTWFTGQNVFSLGNTHLSVLHGPE